jgi:hypothetical protein
MAGVKSGEFDDGGNLAFQFLQHNIHSTTPPANVVLKMSKNG